MKNLQVVTVEFRGLGDPSSREHQYRSPLFQCNVGDIVVIANSVGYGVAEVVKTSTWFRGTEALRGDVIDIVETGAFEEMKARNARKERLQEYMKIRMQEISSLRLYEAEAEKDHELKKLLDEYKTL